MSFLTIGQLDPTRKGRSRIAGGGIYGLIAQRVLWYFPVQAKRPFEIPIPKKLLLASAGNDLETQKEPEGQLVSHYALSLGGSEGIQAFVEKRKPEFN